MASDSKSSATGYRRNNYKCSRCWPRILISELLTNDITGSLVIFQWPQHNRFDKLILDQVWQEVVASDPTYYFNTYKTISGTWWCSSASKTDIVQSYHKQYIQNQQSELRQKNQKILVEAYIKQQAKYICTSNIEQEFFVAKSNFAQLRGNQVQPSPLLHYYWLTEVIIPTSNLTLDRAISEELLKRISSHEWVPYDPDREEIWRNMSLISTG